MIVVTGATGNVGRPLVHALRRAGAEVVAVSRSAGVRADLAVPSTLRPALAGARSLFLLVPGEGVDAHTVLKEVTAAGVGHVVLLSSQAAGTRPDAPSHAPLRALEDALRDAGVAWTVLRPGGFHTNAFAWVPSIRAQRRVAAPFADVRLPSVDPADIAAVAAATLLDAGTHAGRTYTLTGPAATSPRERTASIAAALGEPLEFVELSRAEARAQLLTFMPAPVADGTLDILGTPTDAERAVSPDVELVLGRPAASFADWARHNAAAFRG
ncbi:NAD(P)H-binding protein [Dactylosporangium sp. NPDC005572]|uniref:NAD(P)H-binding protein n=1 Tax=Dactylosporangium sp. NPDC005572 TaxID=3156889 RepID=UPI0033BB6BC7